MNQIQKTAVVYVCPMHSDVRQSAPGPCVKCGMDLVPEGTRFALIRHMFSDPVHVVLMVAAMLAIMMASMMIY